MTLSNLRFEFLNACRYPRVRKGAIVLAGAALLLLVVTIAVWWPNWQSSSSLRSRIDEQRRVNAENSSLIKVAERANRAISQIEEAEKKLRNATSQAVLVQNLRQLAVRARVRILSESYEKGKPKDGYEPFLHELVLQGSYSEIRQFLVSLQTMPSLTLVQEATLSRDAQSGSMKAQLRMLTYRKVPA